MLVARGGFRRELVANDIAQNTTRRKAFEEQTFRQLEGLYRTALYLWDSGSDAKDVIQESIVKAYRFRDEGRFGADHRMRIFKILVNVLPNEYRPFLSLSSEANTTYEISEYPAASRRANRQPHDDPGSDPFSAVTEGRVREAIREIPREFRLVVILSMIEGFSYREIADIADTDRETVGTRLRCGRKLLSKKLIDYEELENIKICRSAESAEIERTG